MTITLPRPFPAQREFLRATSRYVAYGGSRGGGKSFAVREKAILLALRYPGIRILLLRRTYPEVYENHIKTLVPQTARIAAYRDSDKSLTFQNGSRIKFGYCSCDGDLTQYQGVEYDVIFLDEATQFTERQFRFLSASVRGVNSFPKRFYLTCNPGGVGHGWVKRLFIDRIYRPGEDPADYTFIRAGVRDNLPLLSADPAYLAALETLPPDLRAAWLDGNWDVLAGQYFPEFSLRTHVCEPFSPPPEWKRYRALDYGLDMLAVVWAAADGRGALWVYRELCRPGLIVSEAAKEIARLSEGERIERTFAPPDLWNRQKDSGRSMADLFFENGVPLSRVSAERIQGWMQLKEMLAERDFPDGTRGPSLAVFSTCRELIRCLPQLMRDEKDPCDAALTPHEITHICDALRYLCADPPQKSREKRPVSWEEEHRRKVIGRCRRRERRL